MNTVVSFSEPRWSRKSIDNCNLFLTMFGNNNIHISYISSADLVTLNYNALHPRPYE